MSFPKYAEYKESGVAWLGIIPSHWEVVQSRRLFKARRESAKEDDVMLTASQKYGMIPQSEFVKKEGRRVVEVIKGKENLIHVEPDDFVISMRSFQGGLEWCRYKGSTSFHYVPITPIKNVVPSFFAHALKSAAYISALRSTTNLIRDGQEIRYSNFVQAPLPIVPEKEQLAIANFLDRETAKIDTLIAEQERLIELLQEKRQAVISHAVTKGLNQNASMNESGVEWLGEAPGHWDAVRLKNAFSIKHGFAFDGAFFADAGEYILMTPGNFHEEGGFRKKDPEKYYIGDNINEDFILSPGDLIIAMTEQSPGLVGAALFTPGTGTYLHNQRLGLLTPTEKAEPRFIYWLMNSKIIKEKIGLTATGQKVRHTSPQKILSLKVRLPPKDEQLDIANFIQSEVDKIAQLSSKTSKAIALLSERRSALISAAVTGKIDVRGLVPEEAAA